MLYEKDQINIPILEDLDRKSNIISIQNAKYQISYQSITLSVIQRAQMDYEDIIKLEEQSPVYSTGNNSQSLKQCMAAFYDNDSDFEPRDPQQYIHNNQNLSFEQAIDYVQNYVDIVDTPLEDIIECLDRLQYAQDLDRLTLKKKILKRKNFMKRYRAKNRQPKFDSSFEQFSLVNCANGLETEAEIKKKRNRVSAQISRDRKKQYFKELEHKNQKLQEQIIRAKLENQKLKRQIQESEFRPKNKFFSETLNNKLTKLLIFLGILCLIGMLKETFFCTSQSLSKFKAGHKIDQISQFASNQHNKMIEQGQRKVAQFLQDSQLEEELLDTEQRKVSLSSQLCISERNRPKCRVYEGLMQKLTDLKANIEKKNM